MQWTEIKIILRADDVNRAADIVQMVVPNGMYIEDYRTLEKDALEIAHIDLIDQELLNKNRSEAVIHLYFSKEENPEETIRFLKERFSACDLWYDISCDDVDDAHWADSWKNYFKPVPVGEKLYICPSWETADAGERTVLQIDPGAAFGTGTHATTRLCMQALEKTVKSGDRLLDIGCGSGILGIAGLLIGAKDAVFVDIDKQSVKTAEENARLNGVYNRSQFLHGNLTEQVSGRFSVICANIVADVIITLLPDVGEYLYKDGRLICSGIIDLREQDVLREFESYGFTVRRRMEDAGWLAFVCEKNA